MAAKACVKHRRSDVCLSVSPVWENPCEMRFFGSRVRDADCAAPTAAKSGLVQQLAA
jgi:hypothetical protein